MTNAIDITISDVRSFVNCRQAWDFQSTLRQNLQPKNRAAHFAFGDLFHQALQVYYEGGDCIQFYVDSAATLLNLPPDHDAVKMGYYTLMAYIRYAKANDDFEIVDMEQRKSIRINDFVPGLFFSFKYDGLVYKKATDKYYLLEFKTTKNMPTDFDYLTYDSQAVMYQWASEESLGLPIAGTIYVFIRKKLPLMPRILKSGKMSEAKNISTAEFFKDAVAENGFDLKDEPFHTKYLYLLARDHEDYFKRTTVSFNRSMRDIRSKQIISAMKEMSNSEIVIYPSPEKLKCGTCDYKNPCTAVMAGMDVKSILDSEYTKGQPRL